MRKPELSGDKVVTLKLYGGLTSENILALKQKNYERLVLNDGEFGALTCASHIKHLHVTGAEFINLDAFYTLNDLESLFLSEGATFPKRSKLDFSHFKKLKKCTVTWSPNFTSSLFECPDLEVLTIHKYKSDDLVAIGERAKKLKYLELCHGSVKTLDGIELLQQLTDFRVSYLSKLEDVVALAQVPNLKHLELNSSKHVKDLYFLNALTHLQELVLGECFTLSDLDFLQYLTELELFICGANIINQNFEMLAALKKLREANFILLRNYQWTKQQWQQAFSGAEAEFNVNIFLEGSVQQTIEIKRVTL